MEKSELLLGNLMKGLGGWGGATGRTRGSASVPVFSPLSRGYRTDGDPGQGGDGALRLAGGERGRLQIERRQGWSDETGTAAF